MNNDKQPGPMKAWLVTKGEDRCSVKISSDFLEEYRRMGYTVTPGTFVPCPEGMQYGDRVRHRYDGSEATIAGAVDPHRGVQVRFDNGCVRRWHLSDITPIPDEPERTYTEDEWIERTRKAVIACLPFEYDDRIADRVAARLRKQVG